MARNHIYIDSPPAEVFALLENVKLYPEWVPGAREVPDVDDSWPAPGSGYRYEVGLGWLRIGDEAEIVRREPPTILVLRLNLPLVGVGTVTLEVTPSNGGSDVTIEERIPSLPRPLSPGIEAGLHLRNAEALRRLKSLAEGSASKLDAAAALVPPPHWLDRAPAKDVLGEAETSYLSVLTASGPHVTPVAFASLAGRLWVVTPRDALKTSVVMKRPSVSVCVRSGDKAVAITGRADVLDLRRPWELPQLVPEAAAAGPALVAYLLRNSRRLGGYLSGGPSVLSQLRPLDRVLLAVRPEATATLGGRQVLNRHGEWNERRMRFPQRNTRRKTAPGPSTRGLPRTLKGLVGDEDAEGVLSWETERGTVTLPAAWSGGRGLVRVPRAVFALGAASREARAAACFDQRRSKRLDAHEGVMLRGPGKVVGREDDDLLIAIGTEKTTYWQGARTKTMENESASGRRA